MLRRAWLYDLPLRNESSEMNFAPRRAVCEPARPALDYPIADEEWQHLRVFAPRLRSQKQIFLL